LRALKSLSVQWSPEVLLPGPETALLGLSLEKYASGTGNLNALEPYPTLEGLSLSEPRLTSLEGIERLTSLRRLMLYRVAPGLDIRSVEQCKRIMKLHFEKAKELVSWESIGRCAALEELILVGCGDVDSLGFLRGNKQLQRVVRRRTWPRNGDVEFLDQYVVLPR
jgi:hypothetical protein